MSSLVIFVSFCGGVFGSMLGALGAFIFCGIVGLAGVGYVVAGGAVDWMGVVAFGPFFGPHISFGAAVAAAAYAKKKGYLEDGRDIVTALISLEKIDVLLIGGAFGILANLLAYIVGMVLPGKIDAVGVAVVLVALIAKVLFTGELISPVREGSKRFGIEARGVWVPYMKSISQQTLLAITAGGLSAYVTMLMLQDERSVAVAGVVGFFISAISLIFLCINIGVPITHHITVCAATAVTMSGGSIVWGVAGAIIAAIIADLASRVFLCHGGVHVDPPAMGITVTSFLLLGVFPVINLYNITAVAYGIIGVAVVYSIVEEKRKAEKKHSLSKVKE